MKRLLITGFITFSGLTFVSCADEECICINNDGTEDAFMPVMIKMKLIKLQILVLAQ